MRRTVPPSAEIEGQIDQLLAVGVGDNPRESLSELARLGARLIIQRAWRTSSTPGLAGRSSPARAHRSSRSSRCRPHGYAVRGGIRVAGPANVDGRDDCVPAFTTVCWYRAGIRVPTALDLAERPPNCRRESSDRMRGVQPIGRCGRGLDGGPSPSPSDPGRAARRARRSMS